MKEERSFGERLARFLLAALFLLILVMTVIALLPKAEEQPYMVTKGNGTISSYQETDEGLTFVVDNKEYGLQYTFLLTDDSYIQDELEDTFRNQATGVHVFVYCKYEPKDAQGAYPVTEVTINCFNSFLEVKSLQKQLDTGDQTYHVTADGFEKDEDVQTLSDLLILSLWDFPQASAPVKEEGEPLLTVAFEDWYGLRIYETYACAYYGTEQSNGMLHLAYYSLPKMTREAVADYLAQNAGL